MKLIIIRKEIKKELIKAYNKCFDSNKFTDTLFYEVLELYMNQTIAFRLLPYLTIL